MVMADIIRSIELELALSHREAGQLVEHIIDIIKGLDRNGQLYGQLIVE